MYPNLKAEMARKGITGKEMASLVGMNQTTFSTKMNGHNTFTLPEAKKIKDVLSVEIPLEELFAKSNG